MTKQNDVGGVEALRSIVAGIREFYFGYLHKDIPFDRLDAARKDRVTYDAIDSVIDRFSALLASPAAVGGGGIEPDMCWNADNPEDSNGDPEQIADYEVDGIGLTSNDDPVYIDVLCAKSLPNRQMKLWVEKMPDGEEYTMWEFVPLPSPPAIASQEVGHG